MAQNSFDELKALLIELLTNRFAPKPEYTRGLLGDGLGNVVVPGNPDKNYVRFNRGSTEYFEVFNVTVPSVENWPVLIGELPWLPGLTQVVGTDWAAYEQSGWGDNLGDTSPHAPTHEWPDGSPGADPVNVYLRSIVPLRAYALGTGSTTIYVNSYEYENPNGSGTVWGGLPGVDMQPVMTALTTGTARLMGVYLDPNTNTLGIVTGATDIFTDASDPPSPDFPRGVIPVARIRTYGGQASIGEIDIRDTRRPFGWIPTGTVSTGGWPYDDIITVDPTNANADHTTLAAAISAANAGQTVLFDGSHGDITLNKAITLQGINPETSIINSLTISTTGTVRNFQVYNTDTNANNYAVTFNAAINAENIKASAIGAGSGGNNSGWRQTGGSGAILKNCQGIGSGNDTNNYGFLADTAASSVTIEHGKYDGQPDGTFEADIVLNHSSAVVSAVRPILANDNLSILAGTIDGEVLESNGQSLTQYENLIPQSLTYNIWPNGTAFSNLADDSYVGLWNIIHNLGSSQPTISRQAGGASDPFSHYLQYQVVNSPTHFGLCIFLHSQMTIPLRGFIVSLSADLWRTATSYNARMTVAEWTGTADSITSDIVSTWQDGNPVLATNWAYCQGPQSLAIGTSRARFKENNIPIGTTANNLAIFIWADTDRLSGESLYISRVQMQRSRIATEFLERAPGLEEFLVEQYYETTYDNDVAPGTNTSSGLQNEACIQNNNQIAGQMWRTEKLSTPAVTIYAKDGTSGRVSDQSSNLAGPTAVIAGDISETGFRMVFANTGTYTVGNGYTYHYEADGRL